MRVKPPILEPRYCCKHRARVDGERALTHSKTEPPHRRDDAGASGSASRYGSLSDFAFLLPGMKKQSVETTKKELDLLIELLAEVVAEEVMLSRR